MTDCPRGDLRDRLPDLLHGTLDEAQRAELAAHVAACPACAAELELLRRMRGVMSSRAPAVDTRRIAAAVVAARHHAPTVVVQPAHASRRRTARPIDWRAAAAIAAVAVALGSYALVRRGSPPAVAPRVAVVPGSTRKPVVQTPTHEQQPAAPAPLPAPTTTVAEHTPPNSAAGSRAAARGIVPDGGVSDLTDGDVEQLLQALDTLKAVPVTDPAQVTPEIDPGDVGAL
jgi:hypothetical protein